MLIHSLFFQLSVYPTNGWLDQQQLEAAENHGQVGPKYQDWFNVGRMYYNPEISLQALDS